MNRKELLDVARAFWPIGLTYLLVPTSLYFGVPWIGAVVLTVVFLFPQLWWSCVFGLANWMTLGAGAAACWFVIVRDLI